MSSFYEDASLVMIPSGYKTSKVYCAKPTDGTGDLAFTRSNDTATRVASSGLIEKVRTNLQIYSQDFRNIAEGGATNTWTPNDTIILSTNNTAPDGTLSATRIRGTSGGNKVRQAFITGTIGLPYAGSLFIRRVSGTTTIQLRVGDTAATSTINPTSTWQRFSHSNSPTSTTVRLAIVFTNDTDEFEIWGAQLETGDIATDYIATTTAAVSVGPVANVPRLDYLNSTCPKLLLEPQRTNLVTFSEQFDNAAWVKSVATVTANTTISPDGYQNADTIAFTASAIAFCQQVVAGAFESQSHTVSVYAKVASGTATFRLKCTHGSVIDYFSSDFTATTEWQRFTFTATFGATIGTSIVCGVINGTNALAKSVIFYGFQTEANASYATSYIPTLGASVTRGADACSKTGISSLIGQTEGTLFADFFYVGNIQSEIIDVSDGTENNRIMFYVSAGSQAQVYVTNGGSSDGFISTSFNVVAGTEYKIAIGYKANDLVLYINGTQIGTDTSLAIPATSKLTISNGGAGNYPMASRVAQALLFKTRLTNQELLDLTTI